ncbi:MAG TPA: glycoside hydrolase family 15 protein [Bryobacteraceae bacterium]|nr:glycoside hydrolase family 15 protein [Bryobacteraceae bacterium]
MPTGIENHACTRTGVQRAAPDAPGRPPRWAKGAKQAVGTAIPAQSRVWFTMVDGTLSEIFFPTIDLPNTRSVRFLIAGPQGFFSDESQEKHRIIQSNPLAPCFQVEREEQQQRYRITKEVITDPGRDALLMMVQFQPASDQLRLFLYAEPNIGGLGERNDGWVGEYKSIPMLFASRSGLAMALATSVPFKATGVGFVGANDGLTDLKQHQQLTWTYTEALQGNVALTAEIDWAASGGEFTVVLACGGHPAEAGQQARAGLLQKFGEVRRKYVEGWRRAQHSWLDLGRPSSKGGVDYYRASTAVLQTHESKRFPGGIIASLSSPWGAVRGDQKTGGYHVLWPRDMGEAAIARLAYGDLPSARRTLFFLQCTQEADGNWSQNMWLDGTPHWTGMQLDGPGLTILLADFLRRDGGVGLRDYFPMIRNAAGFLVRVGPCTGQDRWEENAGYTPFTMAVDIAALLAAADFADIEKQDAEAQFLRQTADAWNAMIDEMTYVEGTDLAARHGVKGYYMRIAPPEAIGAECPGELTIHIKNHPEGEGDMRAADVISVDALALVRFGLRSAEDPRILDTVTVIDATLKEDVATGPVWRRYTNDGYGEQENGEPFTKTGIGRGWPLFAGERAHFEIARGRFEQAERLRDTMEAQANECGLIPEQVWDAKDIPDRNLYNGRPSGSSMPLVWAHAEYIKLLRSLKERRVWDMPPQTMGRYIRRKVRASFSIWTLSQQRRRLQTGLDLRIDLPAPARVRWTADGWKTAEEAETTDSGLGVHYVRLNVKGTATGTQIQFTFFWPEDERWEGQNYSVEVSK